MTKTRKVHGVLPDGAIVCGRKLLKPLTSKWKEEVTCSACRKSPHFDYLQMMPDEMARAKGLRNTN